MAAGPRRSRDRRRTHRSRPVRRARASPGSRTPACSPGTAPTSTTSPYPGCSTPASCAARSPGRPIRGIDTVGGGCAPRRACRLHRCRPQPRRQGAVAHLGRPGEPRDASAPAGRRRGAFRRRPRRTRRRRHAATSPRTRPSWSTSTTSRCRRSSTTSTREDADALVHQAHGSNVIGELAGLPASALDDVFAAAAHVVSETIYQQAYAPVPMEGRGLVVDYSRLDRRADHLLGHAVAPRGAAVLLAAARASRSTASGW